jgi:hypothetical protein
MIENYRSDLTIYVVKMKPEVFSLRNYFVRRKQGAKVSVVQLYI